MGAPLFTFLMTMDKRTERLRVLMARTGMKADEVGQILNRSKNTVWMWSSPKGGRIIPETCLELLERKVSDANRNTA